MRSAWSETDLDHYEKAVAAAKDDTAAGASTVMQLLNEIYAKANANNNPPVRRNLELLICDLEDQIARCSSEEAYKTFANGLSRVPPETQAEILYSLRKAPVNTLFDSEATKLITSGASFRVKVSAMDLVATHKHVAAVEKILPLLSTSEPLPVQIAACRALARLPDKRSFPVLIKYMHDAKEKAIGRGMYESCGALRALSKVEYIPDPNTWKSWWDQNEKTFDFKDAAASPKFNYELEQKSDVSYYEIPLIENRIVFVLDVSGSMIAGGNPNRLQSAVKEMSELISRMTDKQYFNIVTFSTHFKRWQVAPMVQATEPMKKEAKAFLETLKPGGGTATALAFEEVIQNIVAMTSCETVFLVSDGGPNPWSKNIKVEHQVRFITWLNQFMKTRIHTIGIYSKAPSDPPALAAEDTKDMKAFLEVLAKENDGSYKEVGKKE
jgi:hypothetical protein